MSPVLDRVVHARIDRHGEAKLAQIRLHRARHVRILQLAGDIACRRAASRDAPGRDLPRRRRSRRIRGICCASRDRARSPCGGARRLQPIARRVRLQFGELGRVFRRQRVGHGGEELRDLHQRALQPAEDGAQILRMRGAVGADAEDARTGDAGRDAADRARGAREPPDLAEQAGAIAIRHQARFHRAVRRAPVRR